MASPKINRREMQAYIQNLITNTSTSFTFYPEEVEDSHTSSFNQQEIQGRSTPLISYSGGGPREVSFSVIILDEFCDIGIVDTVNKLKALTYPGYDNMVEPPECYVKLGRGIRFTGQCTNVSVSWQPPISGSSSSTVSEFGGDAGEGTTYSRADVSMSFLISHEIALSSSNVEENGDYA